MVAFLMSTALLSAVSLVPLTSAWTVFDIWPFNGNNPFSRKYVVLPKQSTSNTDDVSHSIYNGPPRGTVSPLAVISKAQSYSWVTADVRKWYTAEDQCLMARWQYNHTYSYGKVHRTCDYPMDNTRGVVSIGMTSSMTYGGAKCKPPLDSNHPYYKKTMSSYQNHRALGLVQAAKKMRENRICLLFLGDSITRQFYYGYLSELQRLDKNITAHKYRFHADVPVGIYPNTFAWRPTDNTSFDRNGGLSVIYFDSERKDQSIVWYEHFSLIRELQKVKDAVEALRKTTCFGITVIANTGLHYNDRAEFNVEIPQLLSFLEELAMKPNNTVLWRETTAQHFPEHPEGLYDYDKRHKYNGAHCVAHGSSGSSMSSKGSSKTASAAVNETNWRNQDVIKHWKALKIRNIIYVPFYEYTKPLWSMHEDPKEGEHTDCTHYCWWPMLGQPVWSALSTTMLSFLKNL